MTIMQEAYNHYSCSIRDNAGVCSANNRRETGRLYDVDVEKGRTSVAVA